ncbi:hypothetical protein L1887_49907 [Cichorium endivia]|nr:hypothetical protein L1887_49907 [Cichorium endivia]
MIATANTTGNPITDTEASLELCRAAASFAFDTLRHDDTPKQEDARQSRPASALAGSSSGGAPAALSLCQGRKDGRQPQRVARAVLDLHRIQGQADNAAARASRIVAGRVQSTALEPLQLVCAPHKPLKLPLVCSPSSCTVTTVPDRLLIAVNTNVAQLDLIAIEASVHTTASYARTNISIHSHPMSATAHPARPRATSYILVSSANPDEPQDSNFPSDSNAPPPRLRPRLLLFSSRWLPCLTLRWRLFLVCSCCARKRVAARILTMQHSSTMPAWERRKIVVAVVVFSVARAAAYAIVGISRRIRQLGVTVAAMSILSTLFYVSVANLLFQARPKSDVPDAGLLSWSAMLILAHPWHWPEAIRQFVPTMPILVGSQQALTLFEWILYIAVVGVKVPPGGNPITAKRWQRNLAQDPDFQRGVDAQSLYHSDVEDGQLEEQDSTPAAASVHTHQARDASAASTHDDPADASSRPLLATSPARPYGYGSTASEPRTPPTDAAAHLSPAAQTAHGMSRSTSSRSGMYSRSPGAAELGMSSQRGSAIIGDDSGEISEDHDDDEQGENSDPDDIIDITPNRAVARNEARLRLARAALPERRASGGTLSTLNIFGGHASGDNSGSEAQPRGTARAPGVFADEAGSPLARTAQHDHHVPTSLTTAAPSSESRHASASQLLPSSSSTRSASTRTSSASKDRKFKLPKWMKPGRKK